MYPGDHGAAVGEPPKRLREDARLASELSYTVPLGIPHSHFLGGPDVWTAADRDKAAAWTEMQRQTCGGCGTRAEEWDPGMGGDLRAYATEMRVCLGCVAIERGQKQMEDPGVKGQRGKKLVMIRAAT